ncbi:porin family protein [Mucilaginibacter arboris]|uniref:Outer membrane beta-barrel protein n=1 Tax=Mucilaginibacter arboris TaxID=2682090 RepID=A0A7K1SWV3_9SPHI|nr:porin family protein [Mucilaginibacter arboris]MVN21796.1 outer membrane beta-barrel protein [Mucilaginibacter arboris]
MMKNCLFLFCLLFLPFLSSAQQIYRRQSSFSERNIQLGFTLSPNIGWMRVTNSGNSAISTGARAGISYGVLGDFGFDRNYFFSTAFTVTSINGNLSQPLIADAANYTGTYKLQYIEIPLTLKLKSNPTDLARFYGQFGLGTGIKISGKESVNNSGNYTLTDANIFRASLIVGAGAEWHLSTGLKLQTGLTLNHGLTNTLSNSYDIKSDYLALSLGIFF